MRDDGTYYRDTRYGDHTPRYWKLVKGRDFRYRDGEWSPWNVYKSGPSWWSLTGEIGINEIDPEDLPPEMPR